jgi:hypothetical protein
MQLMSLDREYLNIPLAMLLALPKGEIRWEAEDIHNRRFEVLCQNHVHNDDNRANKA